MAETEVKFQEIGAERQSNVLNCNRELHQEDSEFIIKNREITQELLLSTFSGAAVSFQDCIFHEKVELRSLTLKESVRFQNCQFCQDLYFYAVKVPKVEIIGSSAGKFLVEKSEISHVKCTNVQIDSLSLSLAKPVDTLLFLQSQFTSVTVKGKIQGELKLQDSELPLLSLENRPEIVLISSQLAQLEIQNYLLRDKDFKEEIQRLFDKKQASSVPITTLLNRKIAVYLALYNAYVQRNLFEETDQVLYRLRILNNYNKQESVKSPLKTLYFRLNGWICRHCFGWGIRISQNILSVACIIVGFTLVYTLLFPLDLPLFSGVLFHLQQSFFLFFNVGNPEDLYGMMGVLEEFIGIFMITVLTGVVVRKLIK